MRNRQDAMISGDGHGIDDHHHDVNGNDKYINENGHHTDTISNENNNNNNNTAQHGLSHSHTNSVTGSISHQVTSKSAHVIPDSTTNVSSLSEQANAKEEDDPMKLYASIVAVRRLADHAEYEIEASINNHRWCIYRRYNEFREFDKNLRKKFKQQIANLPEFPKRTMIPTMNEDLLLKRKAAFNEYVKQLLNDPILSHCNEVLVFFKQEDSPEFLNNRDEWEERWKKHEIIMWECGETNIPYDRSTVLQLRLSCENVPIRRHTGTDSGSCLKIYQKENYDDYFSDKRLLMTTDYVIDCHNPRFSRICLFPYIPWKTNDTDNELIFELCLSLSSDDDSIGSTKINIKHLLCQRTGFVKIPIVTDTSRISHRHSLPNINKNQSNKPIIASDGIITDKNMANICIAVTRYRDRRDKNPYQKLPKHQLPSNMKLEPWTSDVQKEFTDLLNMDMSKGAIFRAKMNHIRKKHLEYDYFVTKSKSESETAGHLMLQLWRLLLSSKSDTFNNIIYTSMTMIATRYEWDLVHIERWTKLGRNYVPETTTGWEGAMKLYHELCVDSIEFALQMIDKIFDTNDIITMIGNSIMPESTRNIDNAKLLSNINDNKELKEYLSLNYIKRGKRMKDLILDNKYKGELTFIYTMIAIGFLRFSLFRRQCLPLLTDYLNIFLHSSKKKRYEKVSPPWQQSFAQTIADEQQKSYVIDSFFSQFNPSVFSKAWVSYIKNENNERIKIKTDKQSHFLRTHWLPICIKIFELSSKYCHGKMAWQKIDGFSRIEQLLCECITWTPVNSKESNNILKYIGEIMCVKQMKHELGLFSMSLLYNTDCMEPIQVEICFMTLLKWIMDTRCGDSQLPDTFCNDTFAFAIERVLKQYDYQVICSALSFILQHSHLFNEKLRKRVLLDLLLKDHFTKLFCHWSHDVRRYFHMVLLYCMNRVGYFNEEHRKKYIENSSLDREILDEGHLLYVQFDHMTRIGPYQGKFNKLKKEREDKKLNIKIEKLKNVTYDPIDFDSDYTLNDNNYNNNNDKEKKEILEIRITDMTIKDRFDTDALLAEQLNLTLSQLYQNQDKKDRIYKQYITMSFREFGYQCQEYRRIQTKNSQNWKFGHVYVPTLIYHVRNKSVETEFAKKPKNSKDQDFIQ